MPGGININNLEGAVKAFALAADQNNDLMIDEKEVKIFNQFINGANLRQDEGLKVEQEKANKGNYIGNDPKDIKRAQKEEEKLYGAYFGKENVAQIKADEGEANRRVISAFKRLKGMQSPQMLNDAIAGRPDMADYQGDAEGYKKALDNWADDVESALDKSLAQIVNQHTSNVGATVMINDNINTQQTIDAISQLDQDVQNGNATILNELGKVEDGIIKEIRTAKGQVIKAVFNNANRVIRVVQNEADAIHQHMDYNLGVQLEATYDAANVVMENSNNNTQAIIKNSDLNHEMTVDKLTHEIKRSEQQQKEIDGVSKRISDNLNARVYITGEVPNKIATLRQKVIESSKDHDTQMHLLNHLANFANQTYISDSELEAEEKYIKNALRPSENPKEIMKDHLERMKELEKQKLE